MNFFETMAPILAANILTVVFVAGLWQLRDRATRDAGIGALIMAVAPLLAVGVGLLLGR